MQVRKCEDVAMKRDMDLIRELLVAIEDNPKLDGSNWILFYDPKELGIENHTAKEVAYHLNLLIEAGFVRGKVSADLMPELARLTWDGHEFLANIKDAGIWGKTKAKIKDLPSVALSVVAAIAQAEVKKYIGIP